MSEYPLLTEEDFAKLRGLIREKFGISLSEQKRLLVVGRLQNVLRKHGFVDFGHYYEYLVKDSSGEALNTLINRISTNHTYFNREPVHFDFLRRKVFPALLNELVRFKHQKLRIWSAGCSSGQEPYQLAMILSDLLGLEQAVQRVNILATDISQNVLNRAITGHYTREDVQNLDRGLIERYFRPLDEESYAIHPGLQEMIRFRRLNLMRREFPFRKRFHVILCRNVMIYFAPETRLELISRFHRYLENNGYLLIGHSETLGRKNPLFRYIAPAIYQKESANA